MALVLFELGLEPLEQREGIGSAASEQYYYDKDGQPTNNLFTDYIIPSISESPADMKCGHVETPSPFTEYGIKGGGEGGRMGTPPALAQAIEQALRPFGIQINELPLTPKKIRQLVRDAQAKKAAD